MSPPGSITLVARASLLLVIGVVLQTVVIGDLAIFRATGDVMLLVGIAAGIVGGPERGAAYGFAAGIVYDLILTTPFGLSALTYCLIAYLVGTIQGSVLRTSWWIPVLTAVTASVLGVILYVVLGRVVGQSFPFSDVPRIAAVVAVINGALAGPAVRLVRWASGGAPDGIRAALR